MPTANRRHFVALAIQMFLAQDYSDKELLIVDDGEDNVADTIPALAEVRYVRQRSRTPLGSKRNLACEAARGQIILHWDDDDWYAPWRIRYQVDQLRRRNAELCGLNRIFAIDTAAARGWEYVYPWRHLPSICGATLCYLKSFWSAHRFPDVNIGEDTRFVLSARSRRIAILDDNRFFVARIHPENTCPKKVTNRPWQPCSIVDIRFFMGSDWKRYFGPREGGSDGAR